MPLVHLKKSTLTLLVITGISTLAGILFFAFQQHLICIHFPIHCQPPAPNNAQYKAVTLHFFQRNAWHQEVTAQIWSDSLADNLKMLINKLLAHAEEIHLQEKQVTVHALLVTNNGTAYLSFDRNPFDKQQSTASKYALLESICKTIEHNEPRISALSFFVRHQPLHDPHLYCARPWHIGQQESIQSIPAQPQPVFEHPRSFLVLLDPFSGQTTGRTVKSNYERTIMHQCAQKLQHALEEADPYIKVVITRLHQANDPLANQQIANRIQAQLYITLHCFAQQGTSPSLALYHFSLGKQFVPKIPPFWFCPHYKAHLPVQQKTTEYAAKLYEHLQSLSRTCHVFRPQAIPFAPLLAASVPAIALEYGLRTEGDWQLFIPTLVESIQALANEQKKY